jgi:hypothetical protein
MKLHALKLAHAASQAFIMGVPTERGAEVELIFIKIWFFYFKLIFFYFNMLMLK